MRMEVLVQRSAPTGRIRIRTRQGDGRAPAPDRTGRTRRTAVDAGHAGVGRDRSSHAGMVVRVGIVHDKEMIGLVGVRWLADALVDAADGDEDEATLFWKEEGSKLMDDG
jgi:hypothetical protein